MRVAPDDEVYRTRLVWLGPTGFTLPFEARYPAYVVWLAMFSLILAFEAITPLTVAAVPVWPASIALFATYALMSFVDHERPLASIWSTFTADITAPRRPRTQRRVITDRSRTREFIAIVWRKP